MDAEGEIHIGVIGGTGLEDAFDHFEGRLELDTPYGRPAAPVTVGVIADRRVAFLPRHGPGHALPPARIPARANAWALASLGVRAIVSSAAVGSLNDRMPPAAIVIPDQLIDRTRSRVDTFFDGLRGDEAPVRHLPFADPFCPVLREVAIKQLPDAVPAGTVAVIEGPRFSTRAESRALRAAGADLVNMTLLPEVALTAELGIGSVTLCLVTDMDAGADDHDVDRVSTEMVFARFGQALPLVIEWIERIVAAIPGDYPGRLLLDADARRHVLTRQRPPVVDGTP